MDKDVMKTVITNDKLEIASGYWHDHCNILSAGMVEIIKLKYYYIVRLDYQC
jgi:hypothetical protein